MTPACASYPQLNWHSTDPAEQEACADICKTRCPLRESCLAGARERNEPWGVWGGEVFGEVEMASPDEQPPDSTPAHTPSRGHYVDGCREPGCRAANAAYAAERYHRDRPAREARTLDGEQLSLLEAS